MPKVERSKLDLKVRKCVLLGYGTSQKGYHLYDVEHMKIVHSRSRDVVFDETSTPGLQRESTIKYVELEINEEPTVDTVASDSPDNVPEETAETDQLSEEILSSPCVAIPCRSTRHKQMPERYGHRVTVTLTEEKDPTSVAEAKSASDNLEWEEAMRAEMESLHSNKVWELVMPPPNRKIVGSKWIFKRKVDADGTIERYKARLVAQGCTQFVGLDYEETFSPVVRFESIRFLLAMGTQNQLKLHQMDVSSYCFSPWRTN